MTVCKCPKCGKKLGEADAIGTIILHCKYCKELINFTLINEPDCRRVTAFIENKKINEKTVSNHPVRNVA